MTYFSPSAIRNIQSNLHIDFGVDTSSLKDQNHYNEYYFQTLAFESIEDTGKLVCGKKKDLEKHYNLEFLSLPTAGVKVDQEFVPIKSSDEIEAAQYSTVRFLLQCRKLSQLLTSTWLDDPKKIQDEKEDKLRLIVKILDSYNAHLTTHWLDEDGFKHIIKDHSEIQRKILEVKKKEKEEKKDLFAFLIDPISISYQSISLALLLSGQAYYKSKNGWERISEPILSTYETVWEYALDVSWDTFYAHRIDLSQATAQQNPPFTKVTLGYPPRPNEFSLGQEQIEEWVTAQEHSIDGNKYPFYPEKGSDDWEGQKLQIVAPPYPYIPLSTT
ncbi:MAG: hypothetical protein ACFB2X_09150 [Rivularia sp. (in: cyanobacteria)]